MSINANNLAHQNTHKFFKIWFWSSWLSVYLESSYWQPMCMVKIKIKIKTLWIDGQSGWFLMPGERLQVLGSFSRIIVQEKKSNTCLYITQWSASITPYGYAKVIKSLKCITQFCVDCYDYLVYLDYLV